MRTLEFIYFILGILVFACSEKDHSSQKHLKPNEANSPVVNVNTENTEMANLQITIHTTGETTAKQIVQTSLKKSGYIATILEKEGRFVKKGRNILALQNDEEQIALAEAQSKLLRQLTEFGVNYPNPDSALAIIGRTGILSRNSSNVESLSRMSNQTGIPLQTKQDIDNGFIKKVLTGQKQEQVRLAQSGLLDAWNSYRRAQLNYDQTFFETPFSGYLANIEYKTGQWLPAGTAACTLIDISKIRVECDVLESESSQIKLGATADVAFPALGRTGIPSRIDDSMMQGKVTEINPVIDPEKHTMRVTIEIPNSLETIKPGMYAEVKITTQTLKDRLLVPKESIVIRDNRELVFVVRDSLAQWCYVQTGAKNDEYVEIISSEFGLKPGEPVVTEGHFSLAHNAKVSLGGIKQDRQDKD